MNARDPNLPVQPDEAATLADFANRIWDDDIVPALTDYIAIPAKSPMFDADWKQHGHIDRVVRDAASLRAILRCTAVLFRSWTPVMLQEHPDRLFDNVVGWNGYAFATRHPGPKR